MRVLPQKARLTAALAVMAITLTACSDEPGTATPTQPGPTSTSAPSSASQPSSSQSGALEQVKACTLLTEQEAATISAGLAYEDKGAIAGTSSSCDWSSSVDRGVPIEQAIVFRIDIRPTQTLDEVSIRGNAKVTTGKVGVRPAKQVAENDGIRGSCLLVFTVGSGRVDVGVETRDTDRACKAASDISTFIDPRLPQ